MSIENAITKINDEMQKDPTNTYLEIIGHYLIDRCVDETVAAAILTTGKTLNGAMAAVTNAAQKQAKGNKAVLKDRDILNIVDTYFKLPHSEAAQEACIDAVDGDCRLTTSGTRPAAPHAAPTHASTALSMNLEDFL